MRSPFHSIILEDDCQTVSIPWMGSPTAEYRVELVETATAVSAVAFREAVPTGKAGWYTTMGRVQLITTRLREPLGDRVFVDLRGEAMRIKFLGRHPETDNLTGRAVAALREATVMPPEFPVVRG